MAQLVKNPPTSAERPEFDPWIGKLPGEERLPTRVLAWRVPWGVTKTPTTTFTFFFFLLPYRATLPAGFCLQLSPSWVPVHLSTQALLLNSHSHAAQSHCFLQSSFTQCNKGHRAGHIQLLTSRALFGLCMERVGVGGTLSCQPAK